MSVGQVVRRAFGPAEPLVANAYRRAFFDPAAFARLVGSWMEGRHPATILEVGCGEGQVTERIADAFPRAEILGVDITPRVGRLFAGNRERVRFERCRVDEVPGCFDLVLLCDVLHHVPVAERAAFMALAGARVGKALVLKDWERTFTLPHLASWISDRFITADPSVRYCTAADLCDYLALAGVGPTVRGARVGPWRNNVVLMATRTHPDCSRA